MQTPNSTVAKILISTTFIFLLAAAAVVYYQQSEVGSPQVFAMSVPSDSCIACHTNAQIITSLGAGTVEGAGGG